MTDTPAARLDALDDGFPMPPGELRRMDARRWVLHLVPKGAVGAEIGVFRGHFSALICQIAQPRTLYLVDPWTTLGETYPWGAAYTNFGALPTARARDQALARCALHPGPRVVVVEGRYPTCADRLPEPLDFAYLDASHAYAATLGELRALEGQVKPDGLILGDDWAADPAATHHGVFRAVQDFVAASDWQILAAGPGAQWAIRRRPRYG